VRLKGALAFSTKRPHFQDAMQREPKSRNPQRKGSAGFV
jgi:hypothetical protein